MKNTQILLSRLFLKNNKKLVCIFSDGPPSSAVDQCGRMSIFTLSSKLSMTRAAILNHQPVFDLRLQSAY
jgi:hypothetical protein